MSGLSLHVCPSKAKEYISPMFVDVCFNFAPFISQVVAFVTDAQKPFPGIWTTYGGAALFIGCTLLAMNYQDQKDLAKLPMVGRVEKDESSEFTQSAEELLTKH